METLYLLLRNNKQSGPYTIDELVQQQLKPSDLIWTEGKSISWSNPVEMEEFQLTFTKASPGNRSSSVVKEKKENNFITVTSAPSIMLDTPEIEQSKNVEQTTINSVSSIPHFDEHENYSENSSFKKRDFREIDETPIRFVFHRRKKNATVPQVMGAALAIGLLFAGWHNGWLPLNNKNAAEQVAIPLVSNQSHTALKEKEKPVVNENAPISVTDQQQAMINMPASETIIPQASKPKIKQVHKKIKPVITTALSASAITIDLVPPQKDNALTNQNLMPAPDSDKKDLSGNKVDQPAEKKRSFGQVIKGLFKKKKKGDDKPLAESTMAPVPSGN